MDYFQGTGRRKESVARVYMKKGSGSITVNGKDYKEYFTALHMQRNLELPAKVLEYTDQFDVKVNVDGGGKKGQAEAIRLGISRAFAQMDPELKPKLKEHQLVTRDPRVVERKKYGKQKARKSDQFSKR
ncbi:MAG: 30S ribosomal protein S9 [Bacteroidetes bacterium SW_11_45_7]|nr:MAG: 30S ribosomal protein S9 [Bacteroidetes bacterium SW_11_45_7]